MTDRGTLVTTKLLREWPLPRPQSNAGKDARGSVVVIGGADSTPGAVLLAGLAALRVGAGRLTLATVERNASALAVTLPESAVITLPATASGYLGRSAVDAALEAVRDSDAVILGPGMAGPEEAREFMQAFLPQLDDMPLVLDALALTCGALDEPTDRSVAERLILTPNAAEAALMLGDETEEPNDSTAERLAARFCAVVALRSIVATPDRQIWIDHSGNAGLGTSGSGDVLAGAIGGLAARGAPGPQAAVWGVHLHAQAGERLAAHVGSFGYLAREIADELPGLLDQLSR